MDAGRTPDPRLAGFLQAAGLIPADVPAHWTPLAGGVSSDIWRVDVPAGSRAGGTDSPAHSFCVKCALPKLKVADDWQAPTSRNTYEWAWMRFAAQVHPGCTPRLLAHDPALGAFAMQFLDPGLYPVWKQQLLAGHIDPQSATHVATILAQLHQASTQQPDLPARFQTDDIFYSIRLEPYLAATGRAYPGLQPVLDQILADTLTTHIAVVHGDVSPKNLLIGPDGPIFLDAECAWFGDPAFDVAFCLNHFLLKSVIQPANAGRLMGAFLAFRQAYFAQVAWESPKSLEARTARLLPALFLARIDGKSPVEYITREADKDLVRDCATQLIRNTPADLAQIVQAWRQALMHRKPA